jgi:ribosome-associated protein YbcJ (S4-like RNA binding protein)
MYQHNAKSEDIKLTKFLTENAAALADSGGQDRVNISSGVDITYRGAAAVKKDESSGGSVEKKD